MPTIMISCGEASGDLYAGALARSLRTIDPDVRIVGFGGPCLRDAGAQLVADFSGLAVTGLVEALGVVARSWGFIHQLHAAARAERPDVFVAIDSPDFNFRAAAALKRLGVPVVYYVSPQVWAWRSYRIRTLKRLVERMLVIFPFEESIYRRAGIPVTFVGHPLVDLARASVPRERFLQDVGLRVSAPTVALLPGSRRNEIRAILPDLLRAARLLAARVPHAQFLLARAPQVDDGWLAPLDAAGIRVVCVSGKTDEVLAASSVALTASGTATVQAALHGCPMVIVYRLSPITYRVGKPFLHIDTYGMVNLVAGRRIMPELIQEEFTPERVAAEAIDLLTNPVRVADARAALAEVRARLGSPGASLRAAEAVLQVVRGRAVDASG